MLADRHVYVEGRAINVCLFCGGPPEDSCHTGYEYDALDAEELREREKEASRG